MGTYGFRHRVVKADSMDGDAVSNSQFWTNSNQSEEGPGSRVGKSESQRGMEMKNGNEVFVERVTHNSVQNALHGDADSESGGGVLTSAKRTSNSHNVIRTDNHAA